MTEAFEKWFNNHFEELKATEYTNLSDAHFWLTAFVTEVERRKLEFIGCYKHPEFARDQAFYVIIREFGLEAKELKENQSSIVGNALYHGVKCPKSRHTNTGYLHAEDDDTPYKVDGIVYCGRCHMYLDLWPK